MSSSLGSYSGADFNKSQDTVSSWPSRTSLNEGIPALDPEIREAAKRSEYGHYSLFLCELDKEIAEGRVKDARTVKLLRIAVLLLDLIVLALVLLAPVVMIFGTAVWIPVSIGTFIFFIGTRVLSHKLTIKKDLIENRYQTLLLYRKQLEKFSCKFDSLGGRFGDEILNPKDGHIRIAELVRRFAGEESQEQLPCSFSVEDTLDLASSAPFLRRYQTERLSVKNKDRLGDVWKIYQDEIKALYERFDSGGAANKQEIAALGKQIAENALTQTSGCHSENLPPEDIDYLIETSRSFCGYSIQALFQAEESARNFEKVFKGYGFLPESELLLGSLEAQRSEFLGYAGALHYYYTLLSEVKDGSFEDKVQVIERFRSQDVLLESKAIMRKTESFKKSVEARILAHPENKLIVFRSKLDNIRNLLEKPSWGSLYMKYDQIVKLKAELLAECEAARIALDVIERDFQRFKDHGLAKNLFNDAQNITSSLSSREGLTEEDCERLEGFIIKLNEAEQVFQSDNIVDHFKGWSEKYSDFVTRCQAFETACLEPLTEAVCLESPSSVKKIISVLFTRDSQAAKNKARVVDLIEKNDPLKSRSTSEMLSSTVGFLNDLETLNNSLMQNSLEDAAHVPVICREISARFDSARKKELATLKNKLWSEAQSIQVDSNLTSEMINENMGFCESEGISLEEFSKNFMIGQARKADESVKELARFKRALSGLLKREEKNIKTSALVKSVLFLIMSLLLVVIIPLFVTMEVWWLPFLFSGLIVFSLLGGYAFDRIISKKQEHRLHLKMAKNIADHIKTPLPDRYDQEDKRLSHLEQNLGLDGTLIYRGRKLVKGLTKIDLFDMPEVDNKADSKVNRKKEIQRLRRDMDSAVAKASFKIEPYDQVISQDRKEQLLQEYGSLYTPEQGAIIKNLWDSWDQCDNKLVRLDWELDEIIKEKIQLDEDIGLFIKTRDHLKLKEANQAREQAEEEAIKEKMTLNSWKRGLLFRGLQLKEKQSPVDEVKQTLVRQNIDKCMQLYSEKLSSEEYRKQLLEIFKENEERGTVSLLMDALELASIQKIEDVKAMESKEQLRSNLTLQEREGPTQKEQLRRKLGLMGREKLSAFLDFAEEDESRNNLKLILEKIFNFQGSGSSVSYGVLCLQAVREINRLEAGVTRLEKAKPATLSSVTPITEKSLSLLYDLQDLADKVTLKTRVESNLAASTAQRFMKSFCSRRFALYHENNDNYVRVMKMIDNYLSVVKKQPDKASPEIEEKLTQSLAELPDHVLREAAMVLQAKITKASENLERGSRKRAAFIKLKKEFYGKDLSEITTDQGTNRDTIIKQQELQLRKVEIEKKRLSLIEQIRAVEDEKRSFFEGLPEDIKVMWSAKASQEVSDESSSEGGTFTLDSFNLD